MKITLTPLRVPSIVDPDGDIFLFLDTPFHVDAMLAINKFAGGEVVKINGRGMGVNLKIIDKDLWSDNVSLYVDEIPGTDKFELLLPETT